MPGAETAFCFYGNFSEIIAGNGRSEIWNEGQKIKSSEVVLGPFVSASSSLLDPRSTCYRCFPCGMLRAIFARVPGLPPTGKTYPTPRNSILPSTFLLVLLDQRFAIDPCLPSLVICMTRVTALESRTLHQPEKL